MFELSLEKQFAHSKFCTQIKDITDLEVAKKLLEDLHLLYLGQQTMFLQLARKKFDDRSD